MIRAPVICLLLVLLGPTALSHDLYIFPDSFTVSGKPTLGVAIHNGDAFPRSENAPVLARVKDAQLLSADGQPLAITDLHESANRVVGTVRLPPTDGNLILSVRTTPNFIQLKPATFLSYLREEGLDEIIEWRARHGATNKPGREIYSKFAKSLLFKTRANDFFSHEIGMPIEIVPENNPYALHPGDRLVVRVMFEGEPAIGLPLEASWSDGRAGKTFVAGLTDSHGRIEVPLSTRGYWRLHALKMKPSEDTSKADWESYWASFTFELP